MLNLEQHIPKAVRYANMVAILTGVNENDRNQYFL